MDVHTFKRALKKFFPFYYQYLRKMLGRLYLPEVTNIVLCECHHMVAKGPFKGMKYISESNGSALAPKLLGTYEKELHETMYSIIRRQYSVIVDIGCAEGYYAVGLARALPESTVYAFDTDPRAIANLEQMARINGVSERVIMGPCCIPSSLNQILGRDGIVICDIEGGESRLLDPDSITKLYCVDILVEIHDGPLSRQIHDLLVQRFAKSHKLNFIPYVGRTMEDTHNISGIWKRSNKLLAVSEFRERGIEWGYFTVKTDVRIA
jgi:hypothetical protein